MAEFVMLADTQRTVYPDEVTRQLHVMVQPRGYLPVIDRSSNHSATRCHISDHKAMKCIRAELLFDIIC